MQYVHLGAHCSYYEPTKTDKIGQILPNEAVACSDVFYASAFNFVCRIVLPVLLIHTIKIELMEVDCIECNTNLKCLSLIPACSKYMLVSCNKYLM